MVHFSSFCRRWLLVGGAVMALTGTAVGQGGAAVAPGTVTLKLMPLALADPWTPTFRAGAEYRFRAGWGVEASYGLQMRNLGWNTDRSGALNNRYHKFHTEVRRYFTGTPFYAAAAGFCVSQRYRLGAGSLYQQGQQWAYTGAQVQRAVLGGLLKLGAVVPIFNDDHWRLDVAVGAGLRRVSVDYRLTEPRAYLPEEWPLDCAPKCSYGVDLTPRTTPGTTLRPTVALDIRLGYQLGH